ncbi:MAG: glycosyltransferase family 2 protein [Planctomycetaceae bacterium]|nr:glycosyltransferase family 2 protein [Planctomycetaceae bacterium]
MKLSIVIPCFNEEQALGITAQRLKSLCEGWVRQGVIESYEQLYVDDGSSDGTPRILQEMSERDPTVRVVLLSRNFGHQAALLAGLHHATGDAVVSLDADLQDPPEVIEQMIAKVAEGCDIVYAARSSRETDTFSKRTTARGYYKLLKRLGVPLIHDSADFRMITRRVVETLRNFREVNLFLRGMFPMMGFRNCVLYYERQQRVAGETKYPLRKMLALAVEGITSFTYVPLRLAFAAGAILFLVSLLMGLWVLMAAVVGSTIPGWASLALPLYTFSGLQMMLVGMLGEYVGKTYMEVKARPPYIVDRLLNGPPVGTAL